MKICLITPPSPFLLDERVFPHIGILKIAAVLENSGYHVDMLDFSNIENYLDVVDSYFLNNKDIIVGITATTPQIPYAVDIVRRIKEKFANKVTKCILGGTHISLMYSAYKKEQKNKHQDRATINIENLKKYFDCLVCGDGEKAVLKAIESNLSVIDADDKSQGLFLTNEEFTNLPLPARHLIDLNSYKYTIEGKKSTSLIAQLGCPFACTFCGGRNSPFLRQIRTRNAESVIRELRFLYEQYGFTGFMFYDDELNVNKSIVPLMRDIKKLQTDLGVSFSLRGFVKSELFTQEQAEVMYDAGFRWLLTGFESGDPRILTNIDKKATVEENTRCIDIAHQNGLKVKALMSIGHAGETEETVKNTKNWLLQTKPEDFDCTIITVYPGSPYFDEAIKKDDYYVYTSKKTGDKLYQKTLNFMDHAGYYKGDPNGGYISYVWTDFLSSEDLVIIRDNLEKEVRAKLNIPYNSSNPAMRYEHSMGQGLAVPSFILKSSKN